MEVRVISFEDLMKECNIDDPAEFRRLLRHNRLPSVSPRKPMDRDVANKIVRRLTGRKIDWYKYKLRERDLIDKGPLEQKSTDLVRDLVEQWYHKIALDSETEPPRQDCLLGLVCTGGFLKGTRESDFAIRLDPAVNILIGDRGSGKSTVLDLLGLLADSVSEETGILVTTLLNLFKATPDEITDVSRRVRRLLRQYSVRRFACFFTSEQAICCYYVDLGEGIFDLLQRQNQRWKSVGEIGSVTVPSMLVLQQGEVIRIAEERNRFYLNNILDALYPDLYSRRTQFARDIKQLATQFEHYEQTHVTFNPRRVYQFLEDRSLELRGVWNDIDRGYLSDENIQVIRGYVDWYYMIDRSKLPTSIFELLQDDEDAFLYLYVGRIIGFLSQSIRYIEETRERQLEMLAKDLDTELLGEAQEANHEASDDDLLEAMSADKEALDYLEQIEDEQDERESSPEIAGETEQARNDRDLFLKALGTEAVSPINRELLLTAQQVADFLQTRLRVLRNWVRIYSRHRACLDESLAALIQSYSELLQYRIDLIREQENKCHIITDILNKDALEIKVFTRGAQEAITDHQSDISRLSEIHSLYEKLMQVTPQIKLEELYDLAIAYDTTIEGLLERLAKLHTDVVDPQHEFLFNPIDIELRQGNTYRAFNQLSFGQKSGIILKMVLATTDKRIITIDQPEDNLDTNSIVNMLAPTLNRLRADRQLVIATHDSNLVMGLRTSNIVVLESLGENGRIRLQGPSLERNVVREMLDVLEGGIPTFELKMGIYEDFISRVSGLIQDVDITMIESSFRRRTIDGLRNFLQPVMSDRALLSFLRHELKQRDPLRIRQDILRTKQQIEAVEQYPELGLNELLEQHHRLCERLDTHIKRLRDAIEEIRLMDTQAKPYMVDLYKLLLEIKNDYLSRISKTRDIRIEIDSRLQDQPMYADGDHLRLVFRNLFSNSLRATERRAIEAWSAGYKDGLSEVVQVKVAEASDRRLVLLFSDNGCGMPPEIQEKLYIERCSDQQGRDHGLGGVIIRKLLDLNGGSIQILESNQSGDNIGTVQRIEIIWEKEKVAL
jgi:signal transduction histidine kinase